MSQEMSAMPQLLRVGKFLASAEGQALIAGVLGALIGARLVREHGGHLSLLSLHDLLLKAIARGFSHGVIFSIGMWAAFSVYWDAAAKNASEAKRSEAPFSRGIHLALVSLAQILVLFPVPGLRTRFLPESRAVVTIALSLEALFFVLAAWARQRLGRHWSGAVTTKVDHELIRSGPYGMVRHPIYSALLGAYFSTALVSGEIRGLIGVVIACLAYWRKIQMEEEYLRDQFGAAFDEYRKQTRAVIPGVL